MKALKTLVLMQLKEKLNLKEKKFTGRSILFATIFTILKFALVVGLCFVGLLLCKFLHLFSLINIIPASVITVVFLVMLVVSIISATMSLTKSMYYSYDNPVLLTLPCRPTQVYFSKLIVFYIFELIRNMSFMVPLFFAFGMVNGYSLIYYPWMMLCYIFISMIPIAIGVLLSIPMMWFYNIFRQYKRLQLISLLTVIGVITIVIVKIIAVIPSNIDLLGTWGTTFWEIQDFLNNFIVQFDVIYNIIIMIVGVRVNLTNILFTTSTIYTFLYLILGLILLFGVGLLIVKPLFYNMASKPFEYRKEKVKAKKNQVVNKKFSALKTEMLLNFRQPEKLFTNIGLAIAMPVLIFFLNKLFAAMNTRMLGNNMAISFNVLIILLIALTSNCYAASAFSRDGRSSYLIRVQPSRCQPLLLSKLVFNMIFMVVAFGATFIVLYRNTSLGFANSLALILTCLFIYFAHLFYSAELDIMNPQIELYSTMGSHDSNPNETKSTLIAFLGSFLTFAIFLFLLIENSTIVTYVKILLIGLVLMIFRLYMLLSKIKLYYMER